MVSDFVENFQRVTSKIVYSHGLLRSGTARHRRVELVVGLALLPLPGSSHFLPGAQKTAGLGHIIFEFAMELLQLITGYPGIHVVFDVPIHSPVEK